MGKCFRIDERILNRFNLKFFMGGKSNRPLRAGFWGYHPPPQAVGETKFSRKKQKFRQKWAKL